MADLTPNITTRRWSPDTAEVGPAASAPPRRRQIGADTLEHLSGHADRFAQSRMRMDPLTDVHRTAAHLDREADLADEIARMRADDAAADDAPGGFVEEELGEALVAAVGDGAPARRPGEHRLAEPDIL